MVSTKNKAGIVFLVAVVLSIVGCSPQATPGSEEQSQGRGSPATSHGSTRVVVDAEETRVSIGEHPHRVVTLSEPTLDGALALSIKPVGTVSGRGQQVPPAYLGDRTQGIPILGTVSQLNYEAIAAAKPDLILVDGTSVNNNPPVIATLRKIAPVVYTGFAGGDWKYNFRLVAQALNMVDEGERIITDYEKTSQESRKKLTDYSNQTFSIVRWQGTSPALILKELLAGQALTDLGLKRPPLQDKEGRGHSEPVSQENIQHIDADWIFFGTLGGSSVANPQAGGGTDVASANASIKQAESVPGFKDLHAYKSGHIIPVDGSAWTSTGGPLLMKRLVSDVLSILVPDK